MNTTIAILKNGQRHRKQARQRTDGLLAPAKPVFLSPVLACVASIQAADRRWSGQSGNRLWGNPNNWTPVGAPQNGDLDGHNLFVDLESQPDIHPTVSLTGQIAGNGNLKLCTAFLDGTVKSARGLEHSPSRLDGAAGGLTRRHIQQRGSGAGHRERPLRTCQPHFHDQPVPPPETLFTTV